MAMRGLDVFVRQAEAVGRAPQRAAKQAAAYLAEAAVSDIVEASPVRTGEYRASHVVGTGAERIEALVFEHPDRPLPDAPAAPRETPIPGPDLAAVRASLTGLRPFAQVIVGNDKFYAPYIEHGTALMSARLVYQRAQSAVETRTAEVQRIFEEELRRAAGGA